MHVLLTGSFGNIGRHTLEELLRRGHRVRAFDLPTRSNRRAARRFLRRPGFEAAWGDLRSPRDVAGALDGVEAVLHLGFVIPSLSATGSGSEARPDWARTINVGGTRNLLQAARSRPAPPRFLFASSLHVYGRTQDRRPPLGVDDPVDPIEHYARHKIECEAMVRDSGLTWAIYRLPATLPLRLVLAADMFDVPLGNRIEFGHVGDVAAAFVNGLESESIWGRLLLIGGGPRCQLTYRQLVAGILEASGVGMLPDRAFPFGPDFPTDWLDSRESQRLLGYQTRTLEDYAADLRRLLGFRRHLVRAFRPLVRAALLWKSEPWRRARRRSLGGVAVVTGGSGGIGAATAALLARRGMSVVLVGRDLDRLEATAAAIRAEDGQAAVLQADLSDDQACREVHARSAEFFGPADVLVNGAGFGWYGYGETMPWATASEMIAVNMQALARLTLLFLADMKNRGRGHIVNIGSVVGALPSQGVALYAATKSFVDAFTSSLFRELTGSGVHVSVVRPGAVRSGFFDRAAAFGMRIPIEGLAVSPQAVARRVVSLLRRPRRAVYVPSLLGFVPWVEPAFGWLIDRLGPLALRYQAARRP